VVRETGCFKNLTAVLYCVIAVLLCSVPNMCGPFHNQSLSESLLRKLWMFIRFPGVTLLLSARVLTTGVDTN